jgi:hydroxymethylbilane synthase
MATKLRIATRGSPLALAQAREVARRLAEAHPILAVPDAIETQVIRTTGDRIQQGPLSEAGGKGLFTREIEEALLERRADIAVHSMKDVPTVLPDGLMLAALLPREDPRDALIAPGVRSLAAIPAGTVVGTASLRRKAVLLHRRPDLSVVTLRGNVETRLRRIREGAVGATFLALAGLRRLGLADHVDAVLDPDEMLPAVCQGVIGIECREDDTATRALLEALDHRETALCVAAERAFLAALDGSCRTPIGGLAVLEGGALHFRGLIVRPDGSEALEVERRGHAADGAAMGQDAANELRGRAAPDFFVDAG